MFFPAGRLHVNQRQPRLDLMKGAKVAVGVFGCVVLVLVAVGCSSTQSVKAHPLKPVYGVGVDLSRFTVATVQPFEFPQKSLEQPDAGMMLANKIAQRLQNDFGPLFEQVRMGDPLHQTNELVITGRITEYEPGSRVGRLFGPGITPAKFKAEVILNEGATDRPVLIAPINKLWAWGHGLGAAKGIEDMIEESAAATANMIARSKGWEPPVEPVPR